MARDKAARAAKAGPAKEKASRKEKAARSEQAGPAKVRPVRGGLVLSGVPRVNLLPPSELERRATVSLVRRWVVGVLATAVMVSGAVVGVNALRAAAQLELVLEQARTVDLNNELSGFTHVSRALAEQSELTTYRSAAVGNDLEWRGFVQTLLGAVPKGSQVRDFNLVTGANPAEGSDRTSSIGLIGRLTLATEDTRDVARMVENLRDLDIELSADAGSLSSAGEEGYTYTVEFVVNQTVYSGRFTTGAGAR